jgi:hypothetical protein
MIDAKPRTARPRTAEIGGGWTATVFADGSAVARNRRTGAAADLPADSVRRFLDLYRQAEADTAR